MKKILMKMKIYHIIACYIAIFGYSSQGSTTENILDLKARFISLHDTFSRFAIMPNIAAMDLDSTNLLFKNFLMKNSAVFLIMRINSNGMIINETDKNGSLNNFRPIASQKWFKKVQATGEPYYGITREKEGILSLFWVWPVLSQSKKFNGAIAIKIDPQSMVGSVSGLSVGPLEIFFKDKLIFKNKWSSKSENADKIVWGFSADTLFSCTYVNAEISAIKDADNLNGGKAIIAASITQAEITDQSQLAINNKKRSSQNRYSSIFIVLVTIVGLGTVLYFVKGKRTAKECFSKGIEKSWVIDSKSNRKKEITTLVNTIEGETASESFTKHLQEIKSEFLPADSGILKSHGEMGSLTMGDAYLKIKEIVFKEANKHFKPYPPVNRIPEEKCTMLQLRNKIYKEIHREIIHWVAFESDRLTKRIEDLTLKVDSFGTDSRPELDIIRDEINKISLDVERFKMMNSDQKMS